MSELVSEWMMNEWMTDTDLKVPEGRMQRPQGQVSYKHQHSQIWLWKPRLHSHYSMFFPFMNIFSHPYKKCQNYFFVILPFEPKTLHHETMYLNILFDAHVLVLKAFA